MDGRLAQAFVRDCTAEEPAVWTWTGQDEPTYTPWTQTSIGFCASAIVLPHDALPPVRVALTAEYQAALLGERRPEIDSDFNVYFVENLLVYVKDSCGQDDVDSLFFLHVYPVNENVLLGDDRRHGFANLDFDSYGYCFGMRRLPSYAIDRIVTGQYVPGEEPMWEGTVHFTDGLPDTE